ncbi:MAG: hypothetical protein JST68_18315 [Bacteroidetes bacterium]|nr:hypothetical protein [Bacteroidota bacterium]
MEPSILKNLVTEVKETVATNVVFAKSRKSGFGAVQMYKLRRNGRSTARTRKQPSIITGFGY